MGWDIGGCVEGETFLTLFCGGAALGLGLPDPVAPLPPERADELGSAELGATGTLGVSSESQSSSLPEEVEPPGTFTDVPQAGHFSFLPATDAPARRRFPHFGHWNSSVLSLAPDTIVDFLQRNKIAPRGSTKIEVFAAQKGGQANSPEPPWLNLL